MANAAEIEVTEGLDRLPAEPLASAELPIDWEQELAVEECLCPSLLSFGEGDLVIPSKSSHGGSSPCPAMSMQCAQPATRVNWVYIE